MKTAVTRLYTKVSNKKTRLILSRLIYASRENVSAAPTLNNIVQSVERNNFAAKVTGALFLLNGVYCQYIERKKSVLQDLYFKLLSNTRHRDLKLLDLTPITHRLFGAWTMTLVEWNEQTRAVFDKLRPSDALDLYANSAAIAVTAFEAISASPVSGN